MTDMSVLITRPKGDEAELTDRLHELGLRVIHEPLTEIFLRHDVRAQVQQLLVHEPDAFILTSKHGAQALALLTELRDMFVLCVGEATAETADSLGFTRVSSAGGNVASLAGYIRDAYDEGSHFAYISGDHVRADLSELLPEMQIERIIAYEATAVDTLSDTLSEQLRRGMVGGVTLFSARAASIFLMLITKAGLREATSKLHVFCLSEAIAQMVQGHNWHRVHVASEPTLASMVACVDNAFTQPHSRHV